MNISKKPILLAGIILLALPLAAAAQQPARKGSRMTREEYIDRYKSIAVEQMERYGIPASITMAQGILESDCGNSTLSKSSNNHFGIKCKKNWTGERVFHDDDARGECFRAYPSVEASYHDHAEFLDSQPRYDSLFVYASNDYRSWARGLKAAGYATAPDYAQRLIRIIEECELHLLDRPDGERLYASSKPAQNEPEEWFSGQSSVEQGTRSSELVDPDDYRVTINAHRGYNVYATNGVHYVLAKEGDTFERLGELFRIAPRNLRKFNDLKDKRAQPMTGEVVYIERKKRLWEGNARHHVCRQGETAYAVGQSYGLRTAAVEKLNGLRRGETLQAGRELRIR
ncbi:glucosaminidase domain-containing protein [uncultured Alistipes sp.]|uniref:glucosaminidase domain-containing protein n=1 Tax=uncultured Alistipes sp. TaxID=538949 RepID=UPI0025D5EFF6|nr:glucosaminidase domain-containing protein [uncultured Alistipes sp.]